MTKTYMNIPILDEIYNDLLETFLNEIKKIKNPTYHDIEEFRYGTYILADDYNIIDDDDYNEIMFHLNDDDLLDETNDVILENIKRLLINEIIEIYEYENL